MPMHHNAAQKSRIQAAWNGNNLSQISTSGNATGVLRNANNANFSSN
jgi:hypothetical protein